MKRISMIFAMAVMMLSFAACSNTVGNSNNSRTDDASINNPYTDIAVVEKIFPGLEGIESVEFEVIRLGSGNSWVPGPTDYQYQGYIVISDEAAEKYASSYNWKDYENEVTFETINIRSGDFKFDSYFVKDIMEKSTYMGKAWIDGNTILFSAQTY